MYRLPARRTNSPGRLSGHGPRERPRKRRGQRGCRGANPPKHGGPDVHPIPPRLLPEQRECLEQLADASRLRTALYPSPKPPPVRHRARSRQSSGGRLVEPVAHRAESPSGMSGTVNSTRVRIGGGGRGAESTRRVETTVVRTGGLHSGRTIRWGVQDIPTPGALGAVHRTHRRAPTMPRTPAHRTGAPHDAHGIGRHPRQPHPVRTRRVTAQRMRCARCPPDQVCRRGFHPVHRVKKQPLSSRQLLAFFRRFPLTAPATAPETTPSRASDARVAEGRSLPLGAPRIITVRKGGVVWTMPRTRPLSARVFGSAPHRHNPLLSPCP